VTVSSVFVFAMTAADMGETFMRKIFAFAIAVAFGSVTPAWSQAISLHGSTTVVNTILGPKKAEIEKLSGQQLEIVGNGSGRGISDLLGGKAQIAMISAPLDEEVGKLNEKQPGAVDGSRLTAHKIGEARVAFAVNPGNPVKTLTNAQLAEIFAGKTKNWKEVGGADEAIVTVAAQPGDGVRSMVEATLLKNASLHAGTRAMTQATQVAKVVAQLPGAIGIMAAASVDGSVAEVKTDAPIAQPLILVTLPEPSPAILQVVDAATKVGATH
jgi:phosphate transport system substrate-binding protein